MADVSDMGTPEQYKDYLESFPVHSKITLEYRRRGDSQLREAEAEKMSTNFWSVSNSLGACDLYPSSMSDKSFHQLFNEDAVEG